MIDRFKTQRRVEFSDTDLAGIVAFSRFFVYMQTAEHELLNSIGSSVNFVLKGEQIGFPRLSARCEYVSPARFEDVLDITVLILKKRNKTLTYGFLIENDGRLVAKGELTAVCCVFGPGNEIRSVAIPAQIAECIKEAPPGAWTGSITRNRKH